MNLPNKLTVLRILLIPVFAVVFFIQAIPYHYVISAGIFLVASLTDFLDGYIARKYNLVTDLGKFLDPIADKLLVSTALIIMLPSKTEILPWYFSIVVAVILARELIISGFRIIAASKGIVLAADKSGKIKTFCQDVAILVLLLGADLMKGLFSAMNIVGLVVLGISGVMAVVSGIEYFVKNRGVLSSK